MVLGRAGGSIWPGIQNLLLAARAVGLGAAPTTLALLIGGSCQGPKAARDDGRNVSNPGGLPLGPLWTGDPQAR